MVRYPRGTGAGAEPAQDLPTLPWARGELRREGTRVAVLSFGALLDRALALGDALDATVANMRFVKPLDEALLLQLAESHELLVTLEENVVAGGAGAAVGEFFAERGVRVALLHFGLPDAFIEQASQDEQLELAGLSVERMLQQVRQQLLQHPAKRIASAE
jgi:1-deoxy-D-xylulose-5-phosphate synthase